MLIDFNDLKVKHASGEYKNMPESPEPDDILYWCKERKKRTFTNEDIWKTFGREDEKKNITSNSLDFLEEKGYIELVGEQTNEVKCDKCDTPVNKDMTCPECENTMSSSSYDEQLTTIKKYELTDREQ